MKPRNMRIRTLQDLVRQARAKPGTLNYGSSGNGTIHHIAGEVFKADAGIDLMHVPYKGSGQSVPAVISGDVQVLMTSLTVVLPFVQAGTVNLLGVTSAARYGDLPNVPAIGEVVKRFGNWHTIYTRMNRWTKAGVLDRMFEELQRAQVVRIKIEAVSLDSTSTKVHPDGTGALKKTALSPSESPEVDGTPRFIWLPRMLERP
jgi:tripartite-type tricarboxylate transporter receptor subunit TctC